MVVPYAGVVYDLNDTYSVHASYTSIFKPHESEQDANGNAIEPEEGDSYELGLKAEFFDGRLSTSYRLPGQFNKLTIGGSASWQSKIWKDIWNPATEASDYKYTQESYWVLDAMAKYQVTEQVSVTLNGNNLTDKKYFSNLGFYDGGFYGDPRNFMLTTCFDS
ncbi:TonB-dependent siderophore receptor [compost metagenome]